MSDKWVSTFAERLNEALVIRKITLAELSRMTNISEGTISNYRKGKYTPKQKRLGKFAEALNVSVSWLLGADVPMEPFPKQLKSFDLLPLLPSELTLDDMGWENEGFVDSEKEMAKYAASKNRGIKIPVLGEVAAGIPIDAIEDIIDYEEITFEMSQTGEFFGLIIKGNSMEPKISDGDVVIVRKQSSVENGEIAVVLVNGDSATVKRVKYMDSGIMLMPTNPQYEPMFYDKQQVATLPVQIIGRVMELRAKF